MNRMKVFVQSEYIAPTLIYYIVGAITKSVSIGFSR